MMHILPTDSFTSSLTSTHIPFPDFSNTTANSIKSLSRRYSDTYPLQPEYQVKSIYQSRKLHSRKASVSRSRSRHRIKSSNTSPHYNITILTPKYTPTETGDCGDVEMVSPSAKPSSLRNSPSDAGSSPMSKPSSKHPVTLVPEMFQDADPAVLATMISDMLVKLIAHNDKVPLTQKNLTRFHSRAPPTITIHDYLRRILKYASIEPICLLVLLVYADRVCERDPTFTVSSLTVHRFIITAITVAAKTLCDSYLTNAMYARVGGISTKELNVLEIDFLFYADFELSVSSELLQTYYINLVGHHPGFERDFSTVDGHQEVSETYLGPSTPKLKNASLE